LRIADCGLRFFNPKSEIRNPKSTASAGMTLIELLVVIVILTTVVAAAIPIMAPSNIDRQLREASRAANTFIMGAQARAIDSGRLYGIALKRLSQETGRPEDRASCLEMYYVEQPPPYTGYDRNSRVCLSINANSSLLTVTVRFVIRGNTYSQQQDGLPPGWDADLFPTNMFRPGDVIEIGTTQYVLRSSEQRTGIRLGQNGYFVTDSPPPPIPIAITVEPINNTGQQVYPEYDNEGFELGVDRPPQPAAPARPRPPFWTAPAPYKIFRQATFTSDEPFQFPEGTAIDLRASGVGNRFFYYPPTQGTISGSHPLVDNNEPIFIIFSPEGQIARVTYTEGVAPQNTVSFVGPKYDQRVVENVFLLVGRSVNNPAIQVANDDTLDPNTSFTDQKRAELREQINWLQGDSRWIVLGAQTGRVVTVENGLVDPALVLAQNNNQLPQRSEPLRSMQIRAAREFAPEMSQIGGR
jgi:prepilin-type N-terminal cleavage/methylation domain-containing protein